MPWWAILLIVLAILALIAAVVIVILILMKKNLLPNSCRKNNGGNQSQNRVSSEGQARQPEGRSPSVLSFNKKIVPLPLDHPNNESPLTVTESPVGADTTKEHLHQADVCNEYITTFGFHQQTTSNSPPPPFSFNDGKRIGKLPPLKPSPNKLLKPPGMPLV